MNGTSDPFDQVLTAFVNFNKRPAQISPEELARYVEEARRKNPKHIAAVKRRRKRKRGGPK